MEITWHGMSCFRLKERNLPLSLLIRTTAISVSRH